MKLNDALLLARASKNKQAMNIFPLAENGKVPTGGSRGFKEATTDESQIREWWEANPEANIGIATGEKNGILVIDIDTHADKNGYASIKRLEAELGALPHSWSAYTTTGGQHLYFKYPDGLSIKSDAGKLGVGLDIRANGGYVVAPGSTIDDIPYQWDGKYNPSTVPIEPLPQRWIDYLLKVRSPEQYENKPNICKDKLLEGERNNGLFSVLRSYWAKNEGATLEELEAIALIKNKSLCSPPLADDEVLRICRSIYTYPSGLSDDYKAKKGNKTTITFKSADEFEQKEYEYLWYPYIPLNEYTLLFAPSGTGKTFLSCGIASAITTGDFLPGDSRSEPQNVLLISSEDDGDTLADRCRKAKANLSKVKIIGRESSKGFSIDDTDTLKDLINQAEAKLVILDPWQGFVHNQNLNDTSSVRGIVSKIGALAKECHCAIILVTHPNKNNGNLNDVNKSALGSGELVHASRSALTVITERGTGDKILVHTKANHSELGKSIKYTVDEGIFEWLGYSPLTKDILDEAGSKHKHPHEILKQMGDGSQLTDSEKQLASTINDCFTCNTTIVDIPYETLTQKCEMAFRFSKQKKGVIQNIEPYLMKEYGITVIATSKTISVVRNDKLTSTRGIRVHKDRLNTSV